MNTFVGFEEWLHNEKFQNSEHTLPIVLKLENCRQIDGDLIVMDLCKLPHLIVAGEEDKRKTMLLHNVITSLIYKRKPSELQLVLIDSSKKEFNVYSDVKNDYIKILPYIDSPIISDKRDVLLAMDFLCKEAERRLEILEKSNSCNIYEYNAKSLDETLPYMVVVIEEFGDMIMALGAKLERPLVKIAQIGDQVGLHLLIATHYYTPHVITGSLKYAIPSRISFRVNSKAKLRVILDKMSIDIG